MAGHPNDTSPNGENSFDIAVIGGGGAGLSCAHAMADAGLKVIILDRQFGFDGEESKDTRTIALLHSSVNLLQNLGLWEDLEPLGESLKVMSLKDRTGRFPKSADINFDASELGLKAFGHNIPNAALVSLLAQKAKENPLITARITKGVKGLKNHNGYIEILVDEKTPITARLVVGADGARSVVRKEAHIDTNSWFYNQSAIACWFSHTTDHHNVSTEFHHKDGPLVVVPMQGKQCGLVWVEKPEESKRLMALEESDFCAALEQQTEGLLGKITHCSTRSLFPLSGLIAKTFAKDRVALIGHAAHVVPPIGAQGLNMGFRDSATVAQIIGQTHRQGLDIGSAKVLAQYDRARRKDVLARTFAIDTMNRSLISGAFPPVHLARGLGIHMLKNIAPLRKLVMRQGMGMDANIPPLMRSAP